VPVPWSRLQYLEPLGPGGGIDASVDEMARYALLQLDDGTIFGYRILSTQMMAELHRPEIDVGVDWKPAARSENLHYALGWFTADVRGMRLVYHNGENPGFRAAVVLAQLTVPRQHARQREGCADGCHLPVARHSAESDPNRSIRPRASAGSSCILFS